MHLVVFEPLLTDDRRAAPLALGLLAAVVTGFVLVGGTAQLLNLSWGLWVSEVFIFLGVPLVALQLFGRPAVPLTGLSWQLALFGLLAGTVNYLGWAVPLMALAEHLFPKHIVELFDGSVIFKDQTRLEMALIISGVTVAAPVCEEFFFRGVLQPGLTHWLGPVRAIFMSALIFSALHFDPVGFMARLELGVLFGVMAWYTGSLWPGIFAHAANNLVSSVAYFLTRDTATDDVDLPWYVPGAMFVLGNVALGCLWALRNRISRRGPSPALHRTPAPVLRTVRPWLLGAGLSVALLLTFDARGVVLNVYDVLHPVPQATREALRELRHNARSGTVELQAYFERRNAQ